MTGQVYLTKRNRIKTESYWDGIKQGWGIVVTSMGKYIQEDRDRAVHVRIIKHAYKLSI